MARGTTKVRARGTTKVRARGTTKVNGTKKVRGGKWSMKYNKSINCKHPKGFSQKQHCKYGRK